MRKLLKKFSTALDAILKLCRALLLRPIAEKIDYPTFVENLYYKTFGDHPTHMVEIGYPFAVAAHEKLEELDLESIYTRLKHDEFGMTVEETYYEAYNALGFMLVKVVKKKSLPYEFIGDRLDSENELKFFKMGTRDAYGASSVGDLFNLKHIDSVTIVTASDDDEELTSLTDSLNDFRLQRADVKHIENLGKELQAADSAE
jgi:hypothetical protein